MPSSYADSFPPIVHTIIAADPKTVLDVGPGWGLYGLACTQWLPELRRLAAVEVLEGLLPTQESIYDEVVVDSVLNLDAAWWQERSFDLVLLIDVIEHMPKHLGFDLLDRIVAAGGQALVSTPKVWIEQSDPNNPYETHVCLWTWEDLFERYSVVKDVSTADSIIYLIQRAG